MRRTIALGIAANLFLIGALSGLSREAETLIYHEIKTDAQGRIIPWHSPDPGESYDHTVRLVWQFWRDMRDCPNGVKYYLQHQVWKPEAPQGEDPRGLGGDQLNMALSSWNLLHGYLGDESVKDNMILMADYYLAHSLTSPTDLWPNVPYPYNTDLHSGQYDGDMRAGKGSFQPDKAASFGAELVMLYKKTGERKYLDAAVKIADTLAAKAQPGDAEHSPWPYRVNVKTGAVHEAEEKGVKYRADYTTNWTDALRLFDGLTALKRGDAAAYAKARRLVVAWLKAYPLKTNKWGPFFEDIPTEHYSDTAINAGTMATYILEHPEWDADWRRQADGIINWTLKTFGNPTWSKYGVTAINEQTRYRVPGNSHTSRHASVELLYGEKTGDWSRKEEAIRRLNWATYMVDHDGKNRYPKDDIWLTDGYGDYVRHYLRAMAAAPELAPGNQNHLLRTSSVIQKISYGDGAITYTKFDARSTERFKLGAWEPQTVKGGRGVKMKWDARTRVLEVASDARDVTIRRKR
jgi:hypothetical protein